MENEYKSEYTKIQVPVQAEDERAHKRKLLITKLITRIIILLIFTGIVYLIFFRARDPKQVIVKEEAPATVEIKTEKESATVAPASDIKNSSYVETPQADTHYFEGFVVMSNGIPVFKQCRVNNQFMLLNSSPLYNTLYGKYISLADKNSRNYHVFVRLKGHAVPLLYTNTNNPYTQGFYVEEVKEMNTTGSCT